MCDLISQLPISAEGDGACPGYTERDVYGSSGQEPRIVTHCGLRHDGADGSDRVYQGVFDVTATNLAGGLIGRLEGYVDRVRVPLGDFASCADSHADEWDTEVKSTPAVLLVIAWRTAGPT